MAVFMGPLNETVLEANTLAEGTRSSHANHLKAAAGSLAALAWIGYTGKGCGECQIPPIFVGLGSSDVRNSAVS
jgi:hypothetical protein